MRRPFSIGLLLIGVAFWLPLAYGAGEKVSGPDDPDFQIQGEYIGEIKDPGGEVIPAGVQVIALGNDKFKAVAYIGGLPGDGWLGEAKFEVGGERKDDRVVFGSDEGRAEIKDGVLKIYAPGDVVMAELKKTERKSPTLGEKAPEGAVVLFDGTSADNFEGGKLNEDGTLAAGATSKQKFGSCHVHVEFQLPFMPESRGQARGNSGCYLQGRYEVQMLDSFGLRGENNECGAIYGVAAPSMNLCYPPLAWQTYDIDFTAAEYKDGQKVKNARITVKHNGQVIHDDVELPSTTTAAPVAEGPEPGPLYLQDHGNPVRYRNVWVVETK
jgi:hypothetical protein